jgi:FkbM family methyltransferase
MEDCVRLDYPRAEIWIRATSPMEQRWRARSCSKEPWTVEWIETHVGAGDVVYDIGANVGTFSLLASRCGAGVVVAFEPGYANFARLCENIQLNNCQHGIVPIPLPLADSNGLVAFKYRTVDPGQSRHALRSQPWHARAQTPAGAHYEQPVCTMRLDDAVATFGLPAPHHLKIDVDGAETRVLNGAAATLRSALLRTVLIEIDREQWADVEALLAAAGLTLARQYRGDGKADAPLYGLFVREAAPRRRWFGRGGS